MNLLRKLGSMLNNSTIPWKGYVTQDSKKEKIFIKHMEIDEKGKINGHGKDAVGKYTISGWMDKNGQMNFTLDYIKAMGPTFTGTFSNGVISGFWQDDSSFGKFELSFKRGRKFQGAYYRADQEIPLDSTMWLQVDGNKLWGLGQDKNGVFVASGENVQNKRYIFDLVYLYQFTISHCCRLTKSEQKTKELEGEWENEKKRLQGRFSLTEIKDKNKGKDSEDSEESATSSVFNSEAEARAYACQFLGGPKRKKRRASGPKPFKLTCGVGCRRSSGSRSSSARKRRRRSSRKISSDSLAGSTQLDSCGSRSRSGSGDDFYQRKHMSFDSI